MFFAFAMSAIDCPLREIGHAAPSVVMPSALATASSVSSPHAAAEARSRTETPGPSGPPLKPAERSGVPGSGLFTRFGDVGLRRPRPSRRSRLARRRSAAFATSAIVVLPSLNFCEQVVGRQVAAPWRPRRARPCRRRAPRPKRPREARARLGVSRASDRRSTSSMVEEVDAPDRPGNADQGPAPPRRPRPPPRRTHRPSTAIMYRSSSDHAALRRPPRGRSAPQDRPPCLAKAWDRPGQRPRAELLRSSQARSQH